MGEVRYTFLDRPQQLPHLLLIRQRVRKRHKRFLGNYDLGLLLFLLFIFHLDILRLDFGDGRSNGRAISLLGNHYNL